MPLSGCVHQVRMISYSPTDSENNGRSSERNRWDLRLDWDSTLGGSKVCSWWGRRSRWVLLVGAIGQSYCWGCSAVDTKRWVSYKGIRLKILWTKNNLITNVIYLKQLKSISLSNQIFLHGYYLKSIVIESSCLCGSMVPLIVFAGKLFTWQRIA